MNDTINVDRYYCINSAQMNEIMVHFMYFTASSHFHTHSFIYSPDPSEVQLLITSTCFTWRPVTSTYKCAVLTARGQANGLINTLFFFSLIYTGIYATLADKVEEGA